MHCFASVIKVKKIKPMASINCHLFIQLKEKLIPSSWLPKAKIRLSTT